MRQTRMEEHDGHGGDYHIILPLLIPFVSSFSRILFRSRHKSRDHERTRSQSSSDGWPNPFGTSAVQSGRTFAGNCIPTHPLLLLLPPGQRAAARRFKDSSVRSRTSHCPMGNGHIRRARPKLLPSLSPSLHMIWHFAFITFGKFQLSPVIIPFVC